MAVTARYDMRQPEQREPGLAMAARSSRRGRLVVLPVDAAYGVGTEAFSIPGVARLLEARGRGRGAPVPVLVGRPEAIDGLLVVDAAARALAEAFWPGPLILVGRPQPSLAWDLGASDPHAAVALRMPLHPVALSLLREVGPMAVTGLRDEDGSPARSVEVAARSVGAHATVVLDAGDLPARPASSIVDVTGAQPVLLREDALDLATLQEACPDLRAAAPLG